MKNYLKLAAAAAIVVAGAGPVMAQKASRPAAKSARIGGKPNLNGIWQVMNSANWDLEPHSAQPARAAAREVGALGAVPAGLGVVEGGLIPYNPDGLRKRDENRRNIPKGDPEAACYLPGIPRATYINHPFQIVQGDNGDILMSYAYAGANRVIHMQAVEVPPIDTWMGTSYGSWEGDTLKVVTVGQNGMTWLDRTGNYAPGTATVTERFRVIDADHLSYEATIEDPTAFTKPWKISMPLYRNVEQNASLLEFNCVPFADELVYGDLLVDKDKYPKR